MTIAEDYSAIKNAIRRNVWKLHRTNRNSTYNIDLGFCVIGFGNKYRGKMQVLTHIMVTMMDKDKRHDFMSLKTRDGMLEKIIPFPWFDVDWGNYGVVVTIRQIPIRMKNKKSRDPFESRL